MWRYLLFFLVLKTIRETKTICQGFGGRSMHSYQGIPMFTNAGRIFDLDMVEHNVHNLFCSLLLKRFGFGLISWPLLLCSMQSAYKKDVSSTGWARWQMAAYRYGS